MVSVSSPVPFVWTAGVSLWPFSEAVKTLPLSWPNLCPFPCPCVAANANDTSPSESTTATGSANRIRLLLMFLPSESLPLEEISVLGQLKSRRDVGGSADRGVEARDRRA